MLPVLLGHVRVNRRGYARFTICHMCNCRICNRLHAHSAPERQPVAHLPITRLRREFRRSDRPKRARFLVSLTRFCWRARPLSTAHQKVVVGDRMYADRQMCKTWKAILFVCQAAKQRVSRSANCVPRVPVAHREGS